MSKNLSSNLRMRLNGEWVSIIYPWDSHSIVYDKLVDDNMAISAEELDSTIFKSQLLLHLVDAYGENVVMDAIMTKGIEAVGLLRQSESITVLKEIVTINGKVLVGDHVFDHVFKNTRTYFDQYKSIDDFTGIKNINMIYRSEVEPEDTDSIPVIPMDELEKESFIDSIPEVSMDELEKACESTYDQVAASIKRQAAEIDARYDEISKEIEETRKEIESSDSYPVNPPLVKYDGSMKARTCRVPSVDERTVVVGVVAGRHPMPVNEFIFDDAIRNPNDFSFLQRRVTSFIETRIGLDVSTRGIGLNQYDDTPVRTIEGKKDLVVYVTGLTSATAAIIQCCALNGVNLTLMHYDTVSGEYRAQKIF